MFRDLQLVGGRGCVRLERAPAAAYGASALALPAAFFLRLDSYVDCSSRTYAADHGWSVGRLKKMPCPRGLRILVSNILAARGTALLQALYLHSFCISGTVLRSAFAAAAFQGTGLTLPAQHYA